MAMKFHVTYLGCKLNQAEIESWAREIEHSGHEVVLDPQQADWVIVNTCTVTHIAARKSRQMIRHLRRLAPQVRLAITGCYADISPRELDDLGDIDVVVANAQKEGLVRRIVALSHGGTFAAEEMLDGATMGQDTPRRPEEAHRLSLGRTRALVKIQDGCDNRCTYCIVHTARGPQRSLPPEQVAQEIVARLREGYREIVLTGVNIGAYGRDSAEGAPLPPAAGWSLARLVQHILEQTSSLAHRIRLSSIEPWDVSPELLALWGDAHLCRHLHLPLQSGCDATLRRMGRQYTVEQFQGTVERVRKAIPQVAITTDIIVGFPGETEAEFAQTYAQVEQCAFARLHVFRYSPRPGTPAALLPEQVDPATAHQRSERLITLGHRMAAAFHRQFVGQQVTVLFEDDHRAGDRRIWNGLTDNYIRVQAASSRDLANTLVAVRCLRADEAGIEGEHVSFIDT